MNRPYNANSLGRDESRPYTAEFAAVPLDKNCYRKNLHSHSEPWFIDFFRDLAAFATRSVCPLPFICEGIIEDFEREIPWERASNINERRIYDYEDSCANRWFRDSREVR
jgi:hypothetical protein